MIVVDSSVWIKNFRQAGARGTEPFEDLRLVLDRVLVGDVVLMEVLQGANDERHAGALERYLRRFPIAPMLDPEIAIIAARNYRLLRSRGITIRKLPDMVIGTFCIERGHLLLHDDRDFAPMATHLGLKIYS